MHMVENHATVKMMMEINIYGYEKMFTTYCRVKKSKLQNNLYSMSLLLKNEFIRVEKNLFISPGGKMIAN